MKFYKEETVILKKTEKIICNFCGEEIKKEGENVFYDYIEIKKKWGYLSDFDGQTHSFDICQNCYKKLIKEFKHQIEVEENA